MKNILALTVIIAIAGGLIYAQAGSPVPREFLVLNDTEHPLNKTLAEIREYIPLELYEKAITEKKYMTSWGHILRDNGGTFAEIQTEFEKKHPWDVAWIDSRTSTAWILHAAEMPLNGNYVYINIPASRQLQR